MFVFSAQHGWQGDTSVQQMLVFSSALNKELFDVEMAHRLVKELIQLNLDSPKNDVRIKYIREKPSGSIDEDISKPIDRIKEKLSDSNAGAIYKLRAVKNGLGLWTPMIRCGITGVHLWEDITYTIFAFEALEAAKLALRDRIIKSFE